MLQFFSSPPFYTWYVYLLNEVTHAHPKSTRIQNSSLISRIHLAPWMAPTWIVYCQHTCGCCSRIARVQSPRTIFLQVLATWDSYMHWLGRRGQQQMCVYMRMHGGMILPFQIVNITWRTLGTHHAINFSFPIVVFAITWLNGVMQVSGKNITYLLTISNFP
jgi:hypothetical protein